MSDEKLKYDSKFSLEYPSMFAFFKAILRHFPKLHFLFLRSGADISALVREASVQALKEHMRNEDSIGENPGPIEVNKSHFEAAFNKLRPSISLEVRKDFTYRNIVKTSNNQS